MMKRTLAAVAISAALLSNTALAQGKPHVNPYSDCGIGAAIFPTIHWAAAISNVIWDLGTTAISSYVSSPETCSATGREVAAAVFVDKTYANLTEEAVRGEGEHLSAAMELFGCSAQAQPAIIEGLRADLSGSLASPEYNQQSQQQKVETLYMQLRTQVGDQCQA